MAHGENAEKWGRCGKEYWKSRLKRWGDLPGKITKKMTHKKERAEKRLIEKKAINQREDI